MSLDVIDLREFYATPLGRFAAKVMGNDLNKIWPSVKDDVLATLGYGVPFLSSWRDEADLLVNIMPEAQGVAYWPEDSLNLSCLSRMDTLPLRDESVNRVFLMHTLENASDPSAVLDEVWRVLKPEGQVLVVVPHRRGAWAHSDNTPFGTGRPYSRSQLHALLEGQGFLVRKTHRSLIAPPRSDRLSLLLAPYIEVCRCIFFRFGGILMVQASKQVYTPAYVKSRSLRRRLVIPMPVSAQPLPTGRGHLAFTSKSCRLLGSK